MIEQRREQIMALNNKTDNEQMVKLWLATLEPDMPVDFINTYHGIPVYNSGSVFDLLLPDKIVMEAPTPQITCMMLSKGTHMTKQENGDTVYAIVRDGNVLPFRGQVKIMATDIYPAYRNIRQRRSSIRVEPSIPPGADFECGGKSFYVAVKDISLEGIAVVIRTSMIRQDSSGDEELFIKTDARVNIKMSEPTMSKTSARRLSGAIIDFQGTVVNVVELENEMCRIGIKVDFGEEAVKIRTYIAKRQQELIRELKSK